MLAEREYLSTQVRVRVSVRVTVTVRVWVSVRVRARISDWRRVMHSPTNTSTPGSG